MAPYSGASSDKCSSLAFEGEPFRSSLWIAVA
jgi:hypothetical protein